MRRNRYLVIAAVAVVVVVAVAVAVLLTRDPRMVTVANGEIVLCTEGEVISDTTEELQVPASDVGEYGVTTRVTTCDYHAQLASLYAEAQDALRAGDAEEARKALAEVVKIDPTYRKAASQLEDIESGRTPKPDDAPASPGDAPGGNGDGDSDPGDGDPADTPSDPVDDDGSDVPQGPVLDLMRYVPDTLTGFVAQGLLADPFVLTRQYLPENQEDITALVIVAEQFKDNAGAQAELDRTIKTTYPDAASAFDVAGNAAYFGTRGSVAIVAFADGAVLVAIEGASGSDDASGLKATLSDVAEELMK